MTTTDLMQNLAAGIVLVCISVFVQVAATLLVARLFPALVASVERRRNIWTGFRALTVVILMIIINHLSQIHIWGASFYMLSYFQEFWTAQYFAAQTYTSLGYGDLLLPPEHRMLSGWLALTGLLMIGWSTALFIYLITKFHEAHLASDSSRQGPALIDPPPSGQRLGATISEGSRSMQPDRFAGPARHRWPSTAGGGGAVHPENGQRGRWQRDL